VGQPERSARWLPDGTTLYGVYQKGQGGKMAWSYLPPWNKELVTGTPYVDESGTLQVTMTTGMGGLAGPPAPVDPMSAVSAVASDPGLQNTHRWNSTFITEFMSSSSKREELLSIKPEAMWTFLYQNSATPEEAVATFGEYQKASDDAFYGPSYAARRSAVEANLPVWLPDERDARLARASNQASSGVLAAVARRDLDVYDRANTAALEFFNGTTSERLARQRAQAQIDTFDPDGALRSGRSGAANVPDLKLPRIYEPLTGKPVNWQKIALPQTGAASLGPQSSALGPKPLVPTPASVAPPPTAGGTKPGVLPVPAVTPLKTPALPPPPARIYEPPPPPPITPFTPRSDTRIRL
jgi:hypothetical protein